MNKKMAVMIRTGWANYCEVIGGFDQQDFGDYAENSTLLCRGNVSDVSAYGSK
jgi:hypothetical protein